MAKFVIEIESHRVSSKKSSYYGQDTTEKIPYTKSDVFNAIVNDLMENQYITEKLSVDDYVVVVRGVTDGREINTCSEES